MVVITKKNCLQIFAASVRVISAMTGNLPLVLYKLFLDQQLDMHLGVITTSQFQQGIPDTELVILSTLKSQTMCLRNEFLFLLKISQVKHRLFR